MIGELIHALVLAARMHAVWPAQPIERCAAVAIAAVRAERPGVTAELLAAIAEHESDLRPNVVSYVPDGGQRVDILWTVGSKVAVRWPRGAVCGYLQATPRSAADCARSIEQDGGMTLGAEQLAEWVRACGGDPRCALAGYAGGWAGARAARAGELTLATRFADLFRARARRLEASRLSPKSS